MSSTSDPRSPSDLSSSSSLHPFVQELKQLRLANGLSQEQLAKDAGISERTIKDFEGGNTRSMRPATYACVANALHLSADQRAHLDVLYLAFQGMIVPEDKVSAHDASVSHAIMTAGSTIGTQVNFAGPVGALVVSGTPFETAPPNQSSAQIAGLAGGPSWTDGVMLTYANAPSRMWTVPTALLEPGASPRRHAALHGLANALSARAARIVALCVLLGVLLPFAVPQVSSGVASLKSLVTTPQLPASLPAPSSAPAGPLSSSTATTSPTATATALATATTAATTAAIPGPCAGDAPAADWRSDADTQVSCQNGVTVLTSTQFYVTQTRYKPATAFAWQTMTAQVTITPPTGQASEGCQLATTADTTGQYGFAVRPDGQVTVGYSSSDGSSYVEWTNGHTFVPVASAYTLVITLQNRVLSLTVNHVPIPFQHSQVSGPVVLLTLAATNLAHGPVQASFTVVNITGH